MSVGVYQQQRVNGGWSRVDLLLYLYDKAITSLEACEETKNSEDVTEHNRHFVDANKALTAIAAGLQPESSDVAYNIARLLHFSSGKVVERKFDEAVKPLRSLREGFAAVADEVNEMERNDIIPPIPDDDTLRA